MGKISLKEKFLGGLVGSALGDCIGELAFYINDKKKLENIVQSKEKITYTDDTAMAIGLAESIIKNQGIINPQRLGKQFHENFNREPYRGYAMGPPSIFRKVEESGDTYISRASRLFRGKGSFGNGASMRITPLGLFYHNDRDIYNKARQSAIVTHTHPLGYEGAAVLAQAIGYLVKKDPGKDDISSEIKRYTNYLINSAKTDQYKEKLSLVNILLEKEESLGFCAYKLGANVKALESVPFSILAFLKNPYDFQECILDTVLVSDDRDTIGAMVGGLLGAYLGIQNLPNQWIEKLENRTHIENLALQLAKLKTK